MTLRSWLSAHRSLAATVTSGTVIAALVATVAIVSTGYTAQRLDLNDGSVWVANGSSQVIGRANTQVLALNTVVASSGADIQTIQRGATVLLFDRTDSKVDIIDPATSKVLDSVPLPPQDPQLALAGDNVVIAAGATGQVWIVPLAQLPTFDAQSQATLNLGANLVTSVTPEGMLFGYSADTRQVYRVDAAQGGTVADSSRARLGGAQRDVSVTSVGGSWVLYDSVSRTILTANGTVDLSRTIPAGANAVLQQASTAGDAVLIATASELLRLPLGGGAPAVLAKNAGGIAAAPRVMGGCVFAAWSIGTAWRQCGSAAAVTLSLDSVPASASGLTFVANADRLVLSDPRGGGAWAVQQRGELIDNWADLITVRKDQQQVSQNSEDTPPEYEKTQVPPVAVNDSFGARPGRASVLPLLLNDYDPNGDVLVISDVTAVDQSVGRLDLINDSQQVQVTLSPSASGKISFGYSISDGRGGTASATVTVTVRLPSENSAPFQVRQTRAIVAAGGRVTQTVLGDWVDPDGDAFYLTSAATAAPDTVSYKPEGTVVFTAGGSTTGLRSVALVVSDGKASGTGGLAVTVRAVGSVPIIPDAYVKLAYAGQEITLSPLEHVRGGSGTLRLASVPAKSGVTITPSLETGTFRFLSDQVGTHYIDYVVNDGQQTANGVVRIDVAAPPDPNTKPITIPKTIFVKSLSAQTIDVASTDRDPAGGVLLVTGVYNIAPGSGVSADVIDQRSIRVTLTAPLESGPVSFNYRISNGLAEAEGVVTVVEIPRPVRPQPPIANDDSVTVRVGDAIDIPVLDNDVQPDGEPLTLNPLLSTTLGGNSGLLFASGNVLRYLAPQKTGDFTAVYEITDPSGQVAQAQVKISVREAVEATNNPPVPRTVTARVLAGEKVRVSIPLTGIDPDGDSVQLLGQATSPTKGSVTAVGTDYLDFLAGDYSAGTDTFSYTVIDALGTRATGIVRVGISPKVQGARNPVAVSDEVRIRPGGTVSVQVLANDSDPDGGTLSIVKVQPNTKETVARIEGDIVKVTPPTKPGTYGLVYTVENTFGGASSAFITVIVSTDAPRAFPVVRDTVLTLSDVLGRDSIDVNVLKNVFFADGNVSTLAVSVLPGYSNEATVTASKRIRVTVQNKSQIIPFAVAHPDDASVVSYAFVWVPGLNDALPQLNRKAPALTVPSESTLTIDLNDYVLAVAGKQVRLTDSSTVQATHSDGASLVVNDRTLRFTSASKYFGPASISFEVTDGTSANDPAGRKATLVLPIRVTPRQNQPPAFIGGVIDFEPGASRELDLLKLTNYPYPNDSAELTYSVLSPLPAGFTYTLTGQKLVLRADEAAAKGATTAILIGVRDATTTGLQGQIALNVVASSRPLARPAPDSVLAPRGQTTTVDVLANDEATNPFPGKPLRVLAIRGLDGGSVPSGLTITPSADNRRITVTASASALPMDTNLQYEVADATGDSDRYVWGAVTVSVQDKPDPVTGLSVSAFGDRVLTLRWSPGQSNNSPITGYDVITTAGSGSTATTSCAVAVCDITTPGNGPANAVRLAVRAINAIGSSDAADLGTAVWSDTIPPSPTGLAAAPLDGGLRITWDAVTSPADGSPVNNYRLSIGGSKSDVDPSACSGGTCTTDVTGLPNGQPVSVTLSARNSAIATLATWNSASTSGTPAGRPLSVASPTATVSDNAIALVWDGAFTPNGREITGYRAIAFTGNSPTCADPNPSGAISQSVGMSTAAAFAGLSNESRYSLVVLADNAIGCTASPAVSARTGPGVITAADFSGPNKNGNAYDFTLVGASIGSPLSSDYSFYYRLLGTGVDGSQSPSPVPLGSFLTASGTQYGRDVSVELRACRAYPSAGTICQQTWSAAFPLGTPVDPRIGPVTFTPLAVPATPDDPSGTFTWPSWTSAAYNGIQYSCGSGSGDTLLPADTSQGGQCLALVSPGQDPILTIVVSSNGGSTYTIQYDRDGNVR